MQALFRESAVTSILGRIDEVLAASRIQELDLIIETLFGEPLTLDDDITFVDRTAMGSEWFAYDIKIGCGFSTWTENPIRIIVEICTTDEFSVDNKLDRIKGFRQYVNDGMSIRYIEHCIFMFENERDPLRWDAWLYLDMHGEEGLQP